MKILIIGHGRHGKDTLAEFWSQQYGMTFAASSERAAEIFIYDLLKDKYGYKDFMECFEDRVNHRAEWKELICEYNKDDRARLAKDILKTSDCYVGMRDGDEIRECLYQDLFDLIIWVDASDRLPPESSDSFDIDKSYADIIIDNNGSIEDLEYRAEKLGDLIFG